MKVNMPTGVYVRSSSEKARLRNMMTKIRPDLTGRKASDETRRKMSLSRKGFKMSEEQKQKISVSRTGMKFSESHKRNISLAKKGKKQSSDLVERRIAPLRGRKRGPYPEEWKRNMSIAHKGKHYPKISEAFKKVERTEEWCKNISLSLKGKKHKSMSIEGRANISASKKGKPLSEEHKLNIKAGNSTSEARQKHSLIRSKLILPFRDTKIEMIVHEFLVSRGYNVVRGKAFKVGKTYHQVDRWLPDYNLAIECDGAYWHSSSKAIARDAEVDKALFDQGVKLVRLSEADIYSGEFAIGLESGLMYVPDNSNMQINQTTVSEE